MVILRKGVTQPQAWGRYTEAITSGGKGKYYTRIKECVG